MKKSSVCVCGCPRKNHEYVVAKKGAWYSQCLLCPCAKFSPVKGKPAKPSPMREEVCGNCGWSKGWCSCTKFSPAKGKPAFIKSDKKLDELIDMVDGKRNYNKHVEHECFCKECVEKRVAEKVEPNNMDLASMDFSSPNPLSSSETEKGKVLFEGETYLLTVFSATKKHLGGIDLDFEIPKEFVGKKVKVVVEEA